MLALSSTSKYELYLLPTDMRKSFDSLSGIVLQELQSRPTDGVAYLFINKLRNKVKILQWRTGGFVLYYKRLERGTFEVPHYDKTVKSILLTYPQLILLFDGITIGNLSQRIRYKSS
jgi:transposase